MQTKRQSLLEAIINVLVGYCVAILSQLLIFPIFSIEVTFSENLLIGLYFTCVGIIRSYCLRRFFNRRHDEKDDSTH